MAVTLERPAPPKPPPPQGRGDRGGEGRPELGPPLRLFVWLVVAAVAMFFLGLSSALLARAGSAGWVPAPRPGVLWPGTFALLVSSALLESGRRALARGEGETGANRLRWGALLGAGFLAGQLSAWRWLAGSGVGLASGPGAAYFYVLSGAHLLHVAGGLTWWLALLRRLRRPFGEVGVQLSGLAVYWHFLAALWVWLFVLLFTR